MFPISRDPPEGGTLLVSGTVQNGKLVFPISRDPPEGGTNFVQQTHQGLQFNLFPISRDPPEGGTSTYCTAKSTRPRVFPISRDPPEGGTPKFKRNFNSQGTVSNF